MKKVKATNFYIPNNNKPLKFFNIEDLTLSDIQIITDQISESKDDIVKVCFSDGNKRNLMSEELSKLLKLIILTIGRYTPNIYGNYESLMEIPPQRITKRTKENLLLKGMDED